ncbi:uncharacterized protein LOC100822981 isoform X2 [Brachypodium distachyon]|uniref:Uncharacterized protein n=1 Tax=Brachypodium distachyon TaxID=15368 RepID=A0A2K2CLS2_BRADI|nr:uncharacterized protein LOC100822981 isoform X2 [Brachypodium distachyon]PNT62973.1 hypothetical protein BRADI_4g10095v3 [Brachypodium distachyon]|eukprot:XP_010237405.1 uncharacterized protein LOC100822981 isoform X2 [Brachypodium distachyon]
MAPQPPLQPPAAFDDYGLPPCDPTLTSYFDQGFLKAAYDGDLSDVRKGAKVVGRGLEGRRLAERLGAVRDGIGMGLLHSAALGGSLPVCRFLVEDLRLDIDAAGPHGETPLTFAMGIQNVAMVRYILEQGADPEKANAKGSTPLHFATGIGNLEIVELLLSNGACVNGLSLGGTALHAAVHDGRDDIVKVLLDNHADHKITLSGTGYTALVIATMVGSLKCVKLLLEAGADVDGKSNETPLMFAASTGGLTDILKCLVLAGADANVTDSKAMLATAKFKAHEAFKNGNYLVAAGIYKEAVELDPHNATLLANSSLCFLRFGDGVQALKDAQACRMMRPGWSKACYREGTALMLLKEYGKASGAFLDGLKLEPGNVEIEDGLREAMKALKMSS